VASDAGCAGEQDAELACEIVFTILKLPADLLDSRRHKFQHELLQGITNVVNTGKGHANIAKGGQDLGPDTVETSAHI
jgi:hypothetical protein